MTTDLQLDGPTVTLFGERDELDAALSDELGRRGCSTHSVTIPMGWLRSVEFAVVRINTRSGELAMRELAEQGEPPTHVVAVCETSPDAQASDLVEAMCRQGGELHHISLIWHEPFDAELNDPTSTDGPAASPIAGDLAATIADEVGLHHQSDGAASFATQTYVQAPPNH